MSASVRRNVPGCLERIKGSLTLWRRTPLSLVTACFNASWINSFRVEPLSAATDFTWRNKGSGRSTVVLIKPHLHKSACGASETLARKEPSLPARRSNDADWSLGSVAFCSVLFDPRPHLIHNYSYLRASRGSRRLARRAGR